MYANLIALLMARLPFDINDEEGQGMAEYGLILALIAVVVIVALTSIGTGLKAKFETIAAEF